jgi:hypothetical protein
MNTVIAIVIGGAALLIFLWLMGGRRSTPNPSGPKSADQASQVDTLTGLLGGSVEDAAKAQYALKALEEKTGQPPTLQDIGMAVGMVQGAKGNEPADDSNK